MSVVKIDVLPDPTMPEGGHAIIRLRGVALLPPGATFRIDPIDDALNDNHADGWPHGEHHPLETRQTAYGIEMRVGPSIVDAPLLEPGTPVTISVPDGELSGDIVWPDIPLSNALVQAPVLMTPAQMASEIAASELAKAKAAREAKEEAELKAREDAAAALARERDRVKAAQAETARLAALEQQRMLTASRDLEAVLALDPIETGGAAQPSAGGPKTDLTREAAQPARTGLQNSLSRLAKTSESKSVSIDNRADSEARVGVTSGERDKALPTLMFPQNIKPPVATQSAPAPELQSTTLEGSVVHDEPSDQGRYLPFLAGACATAAMAGLVLLALSLTKGLPTFGPQVGTTLEASSAARGLPSGVLADAFSAGPQSPRGEIASDVDLPTALRLADYNLHGVDRPVDRVEGEFWLKKALSLTASHSQLRWAITQLGTLAAEPVTGQPDYVKARALWEISAANGDSVAMCFLGAMLENGLGVAVDKAQALTLFRRSKDAGGCPTGDEAIARLSQ
jgi:Sel1 repeat